MCGIAGILAPERRSLSEIYDMTKVQSHRGPDGYGHVLIDGRHSRFFQELNEVDNDCVGHLALGHRRLAILDLSPSGLQPMAVAGGDYWISYNGEIYNFIELRQELEKQGYNFSSETDTEVVLAAYQTWGVDCFSRFNGMWAMAIWDGLKEQLILSRDRFGIKPLHYACLQAGLVFSSEIKGVLASKLLDAKLDAATTADYLKWGVLNHSSRTFFKDILSFPPGHYAVVKPENPTQLKFCAFWTLKAPDEPLSIGRHEAEQHFYQLFQSAVALRMRSDVPVGSCLSGGLDSSAIVCLAAEHGTQNGNSFNTFSSCFDDPQFDERKWSDLVNQKMNARSHHIFPTAAGFCQDFEDLIWHQEEPFSTISMYAQWCIMKAAREQKVPVLLDGQGADEVLCGYRKYYMFYFQELVRRRQWRRLIVDLYYSLLHGDRGLVRWRDGVRYLPSFLRRHLSFIEEIITPDRRDIFARSNIVFTKASTVSAYQIDDLNLYSIPALLRYEDRNTMAWSIESRVPFLDYRIVEFLIGLPCEIKMSKGRTKAVMRSALRGIVPEQILNRRDKMGFVTPQEIWLREDMRQAVQDRFAAKDFRAGCIINQAKLLDRWKNFLEAKNPAGAAEFFRVFIFDAWLERFDVTC